MTLYGLTPAQRTALDWLSAYEEQHGTAPSYDEIRIGLGLSSKSRVHALLKNLEQRGAVRRRPGRHRMIAVVTEDDRMRLTEEQSRVVRALSERTGLSPARIIGLALCALAGGERFQLPGEDTSPPETPGQLPPAPDAGPAGLSIRGGAR